MGADGKIVIIGGGIGGLTAALALLQRGIDVAVYEQAAELKEVGAGVQIGPNGTRVLYALGLEHDLDRVHVVASGKEIRLWNTGQTWTLFDLGQQSVERYGVPYLMLHRRDLHAVLAGAIAHADPGALHLGKKCVAVTQNESGAIVRFEDGETVRASAVIGADGINSKVRESLFGKDRPEFSGIVAWRGMVPANRLPSTIKMNVATNWVGPGAHVVHYPLRRGELLNVVGIVEDEMWQVESWTQPGSKDEMHEKFRGWHADIHALIDAYDVPYKWALMGRAPMPRWSEGCVTLLGDACHSMMPMLAQGACQALEDGLVIARCLEKYAGKPEMALRHYELARRERANKAVQGSAENAKRFHSQQMADAAQADAYVAGEWQENKIKARYDWLFDYDANSTPV